MFCGERRGRWKRSCKRRKAVALCWVGGARGRLAGKVGRLWEQEGVAAAGGTRGIGAAVEGEAVLGMLEPWS